MILLSSLPIGKSAVIKDLLPGCPHRLSELGFNPGERVEPVYASPLGLPRAYLVLGGIVALRKQDSDMVIVEE